MPRKSLAGTGKTTRCTGTWNGIAFRVTHTPDYLVMGADHIEIETIRPAACHPQPRRPPLPITETGYLSHFLRNKSVADARAARTFFLEWIARQTASPAYRKKQAMGDQLDLFAALTVAAKPRP
jgi:hypothetical protein